MRRLKEIVNQIEQRENPPVHRWNPQRVGAIDIRIDARGHWFHEGDPISRDSLVRLFASILWHERGQYYLVTPIEKLAIEVEDVPYLIHQTEFVDGAWVAVTNTREHVIVGAAHLVELRRYQERWVPYVNVRYDLWARVNRSVYYDWVSTAMESCVDGDRLMLSSQGYEFEVAR